MKAIEIKITSYDVGNGYYVDVERRNDNVEFWMCHKDYGVKQLMFGENISDCPKEQWEDIISANCESYIDTYVDLVIENE